MPSYAETYSNSHAIIVGINEYASTGNLSHARNDAEALATSLVGKCGFSDDNVTTIFDTEATKETIEEAFYGLTQDGTSPDDRVLFFFAGHGHTVSGTRGDMGFLVPHHGSPDRVGSLIEWHTLVKHSELIQAKHILFIVDACFSGLVFQRITLRPGSTRFLRDIMTRLGRQGLAAGKSDQLVSDAGGPLAGHSVFTGYLLKGIEGEAADKHGVLTANGLSSFIYQRVASDYDSSQTPSHGALDGEGDFVFYPQPTIASSSGSEREDTVEVPVVVASSPQETISTVDKVKMFLADDTKVIALDDLLVGELRRTLGLIGADRVEMSGGNISEDTTIERLRLYEQTTKPLRLAMAAIGYWGQEQHAALAQKVLFRLGESVIPSSGNVGWISLSHYPLLLSFYALGLASIIRGRYRLLSHICAGRMSGKSSAIGGQPILVAAGNSYLELNRHDMFKVIETHKNHFSPVSEYLHVFLQPEIDDLFFLGESYEDWFDRFESFFAVAYVHKAENSGYTWAPPGRYAWKYRKGFGEDPIAEMKKTVAREGDKWAPLQAGFFGGTAVNFALNVKRLEDEFLRKLNWY